MKASDPVRLLLGQIYGQDAVAPVFGRLSAILDRYQAGTPEPRSTGISERDVILITYPDQVQESGQPTLRTLAEFCDVHLADVVSGLHLLPFYPWSSDDGFSVTDYRTVAPQYGDWGDIHRFRKHFRLMFDAVINHTSSQSIWFQSYLNDDPKFQDYYINVEGNPDLSRVVRPRALPLLSRFQTQIGNKIVWTTFSPDQVDLNYHNPEVLLEIIDLLLFYVNHGAEFIRLDAIAYLWKEIGTSCINLPQTHAIVRLFRAVLDEVAPGVVLLTETNVPFEDNISYFGNGRDEAQMVYNFPLPPLILHALQTGNAEFLSRWAADMKLPSNQVAFFNFLASHDGVGLNPVRGILPEAEIDAMIRRVEARGGLVSYKNNPDGTQSVYELNVNYLDALSEPDEPLELQVDRFVTAHAIMLSFKGVPGIYFHSLFGSRGWAQGVALTGRNRSINRQKLERRGLERELADPASLRSQIFGRLSRLLALRSVHSAFAPQAAQQVMETGHCIFGLLRENAATKEIAVCLHNLRPEAQRIDLNLAGPPLTRSTVLHDLIGSERFEAKDHFRVSMRPYQFMWLVGQT